MEGDDWEDASGGALGRMGSETLRDWGAGFGVRRQGETPGSGTVIASGGCVGWSPGSFSLRV